MTWLRSTLTLFWLMWTTAVLAQREADLPDPDTTASAPAADSAFMALKQAYITATDTKNRSAAATALRDMGRICSRLGHYPQALDYHMQATSLLIDSSFSALKAENLNDLGSLYYYNRQLPRARDYYNEALAIYRHNGDYAGMALTFGKIGHLFEKQQAYDSAFYFQRLAMNYCSRTDHHSGLAKIFENTGSIYEDLERYDSALYYFRQALDLNLRAQELQASIEIYNNLGDVYRKTGHYNQALFYTRSALDLSDKLNDQYQLSSACRDIARTYRLTGQHDSAYDYLDKSRRYLQETSSRESGRQEALLRTMYDMEKKNSEMERLRNGRKFTGALALVCILLAVTGVLTYSHQRLKIRNTGLMHLQEKQAFQAQHSLMEIQEQHLKQELETRSRELSAHTLHIIQKNQLLENLQTRLEEMVKEDKRDQKKQLKQLQLQIHQNFNHDRHWDEFRGIFEQVHQSFLEKLRQYCDALTPNDLRLVALLRMNIASADIATILGISPDSLRVVRYRLRKKLQLQQGESLTVFIQSL